MIIATYVYHHAQGYIQDSNVNSQIRISSCNDTYRLAMLLATYVYHHAHGYISVGNVNSYLNISSCTRIHTG